MPNNLPAPPPSPPRSPPPAAETIDPHRYRRVRWFFARAFLHAFFWDFLLSAPLLRRLRPPPIPRWCRIAARYRTLAVEMGGVLIKLGQFLSSRVDLLPVEVTRELAGLQDEVPPAAVAAIVAQIEEDFGCSVDELFPELDPQPLGAASLAQVHRARLPTGEAVVVKALRPGIEVVVETDLTAFCQALSWLRIWRQLRRRVDLERVARELTATTRRELDMRLEGKNAERFAGDFARQPGIGFPAVLWPYTARRTLTMEDVAFIKIGDHAALEAAGIRRQEVARAVYRAYMRQVFLHNFVHADPHPGNLFVRPLEEEPAPAPAGGLSHGEEQPRADRPFRLYFVDFGMMAEIPERLREALRAYAISLGRRDAAGVVAAYAEAGVLLPGADLERLTEIHQEIFERFWGVGLGQLRDLALAEAPGLIREYRDLLYQAPFQFPVDLLFVLRAMGLLSGLATSLDPDFDPWAETIPFAEELARSEVGRGAWPGLEELMATARQLWDLPRRLDAALHRAESGEVSVEVRFSREARRELQGIEAGIQRLSWAVAGAALLISGSGLYALEAQQPLGLALAAGGGATLLWGLLRSHRPR